MSTRLHHKINILSPASHQKRVPPPPYPRGTALHETKKRIAVNAESGWCVHGRTCVLTFTLRSSTSTLAEGAISLPLPLPLPTTGDSAFLEGPGPGPSDCTRKRTQSTEECTQITEECRQSAEECRQRTEERRQWGRGLVRDGGSKNHTHRYGSTLCMTQAGHTREQECAHKM